MYRYIGGYHGIKAPLNQARSRFSAPPRTLPATSLNEAVTGRFSSGLGESIATADRVDLFLIPREGLDSRRSWILSDHR